MCLLQFRLKIFYCWIYLYKVSTCDLGLNKDEEAVMIEMVGKRYNQGRKEIRLTADRFPNRIENKRYLVCLLENLVREAKNLALKMHTM